jgi:undecaprenyl-diphosphatase
MDALIVFTARYLIILIPLALLQVIWILPHKERVRFVLLSIFSFFLAYLFAKVGSALYDNPRPFVVGEFIPLVPHGVENGFPSLHTLFASTAAFLSFRKHRIVGSLLILTALCIGIARVLGGVHHGIDVFAGFSIALIAVIVAELLLRIKVRS